MASIPLSDLPVASKLTDNDYMLITQSGASKKVRFDVLKGAIYNDDTIYGFHIDGSESDPYDRVTYLEGAVGYTPAHMDYTNDVFDYGSWENAWFMPRPCMLLYNGTVAYYLDPLDYTKKIDGTASDVGNSAFQGNAMMEWGQNGTKIWTKIVPTGNGNSADIYIAKYQIDEDYHAWNFINNQGELVDHFYTPIYNGAVIGGKMRSLSGQQTSKALTAQEEIDACKANNPASDVLWYTEVFADVQLINLLLILIGKSTNTQAVFGEGLSVNGSEAINNGFRTGVHNTKGLFYGTNSGVASTYTNAVKVFGMENWWGFQWRRIAGLMGVSGDIKYKLTYGTQDGSTAAAYNTTGSGYKSSGVTPSEAPGGFISQDKFTADGMFPAVTSGSSSTYDCDVLWFSNSATSYAVRGGRSDDGANVGALYVLLNSAPSVRIWHFGCAPSCKPLA